jgi:hypothetical protein
MNITKNAQQQPLTRGAVNNKKITTEVTALLTVASTIIAASSLHFDKSNGLLYDGKKYFSLFGHGGRACPTKMPVNCQIDTALCKGITLSDTMTTNLHCSSRNCNRSNQNDIVKRPELDNCYHEGFTQQVIYNHLIFLSGVPNNKNTLQKRLRNVLPTATIEQLNGIAEQVHQATMPLALVLERKWPKRHKCRDHNGFTQLCVEHSSMVDLY